MTNNRANADSLTGKDGTKWVLSLVPESPGRIQQQNITRKQPGVKPFVAARVSTVGDAWFDFFDNAMIDRVLQITNSNQKRKTVITKQKFKTFVALHYLCGLHSKNIPLTYFWSNKYGSKTFRNLMSRNRYKEIMSCVRLCAKTTRSYRVCTDRFEAGRELMDSFVKNCQEKYVPEFPLTVDSRANAIENEMPIYQFHGQQTG